MTTRINITSGLELAASITSRHRSTNAHFGPRIVTSDRVNSVALLRGNTLGLPRDGVI
jgi:hypothetical protein